MIIGFFVNSGWLKTVAPSSTSIRLGQIRK